MNQPPPLKPRGRLTPRRVQDLLDARIRSVVGDGVIRCNEVGGNVSLTFDAGVAQSKLPVFANHVVKLTSAFTNTATTAVVGVYNGTVYPRPSVPINLGAATNLPEATAMQTTGESVIALNSREINMTTSGTEIYFDAYLQPFFPCIFWGMEASTGRKIVLFRSSCGW